MLGISVKITRLTQIIHEEELMKTNPMYMFLTMMAGWINRHQQKEKILTVQVKFYTTTELEWSKLCFLRV